MDRGEKAKQYFLQGYNCSQAVALAFADIIDLDADLIAKLVSGYGGGIGRMREVCGSVCGAVFVLSYICGYNDPKDYDAKKNIYCEIQDLCKQFEKENGSIICRELLGLDNQTPNNPTPEKRSNEYYKKRPCAEIVKANARILEKHLTEKNKND